MRKFVSVLCVLIFIFSFTACKAKNSANSDSFDSESGSQSQSSASESGERPQPDYTVVRADVKNGDKNIYGELFVPSAKKEKYPLVILSHSAFLTGNSLKDYAIGFAERGFMAYIFDFCGGSPFSKSDGSQKTATIFTFISDLDSVIAEFSDRADVSEINLFGTSQGGLISALTAAKREDKISRLMLLYPAFNIPDEVTANPAAAEKTLGKDYADTIKDYDVYAAATRYSRPVLIIHGTKDTRVNISYSERAAREYKDCVLKTVEGASHGFNSANFSFKNYDSVVWGYIDEFISDKR